MGLARLGCALPTRSRKPGLEAGAFCSVWSSTGGARCAHDDAQQPSHLLSPSRQNMVPKANPTCSRTGAAQGAERVANRRGMLLLLGQRVCLPCRRRGYRLRGPLRLLVLPCQVMTTVPGRVAQAASGRCPLVPLPALHLKHTPLAANQPARGAGGPSQRGISSTCRQRLPSRPACQPAGPARMATPTLRIRERKIKDRKALNNTGQQPSSPPGW